MEARLQGVAKKKTSERRASLARGRRRRRLVSQTFKSTSACGATFHNCTFCELATVVNVRCAPRAVGRLQNRPAIQRPAGEAAVESHRRWQAQIRGRLTWPRSGCRCSAPRLGLLPGPQPIPNKVKYTIGY